MKSTKLKKKNREENHCKPGMTKDLLNNSQIAQLVKNLPEMQEMWVQFLGQEDPLEKEVATHSSFLAWEIPWTEEPGGLQSLELQKN